MSYFVLHQFRPTETVDAVIRLKGRHNYTREEILILRERFNELNGARVPRPGDVYKIPLEGLVVDDFGQLLDLMPLTMIDGPVVADPGANGEEPAQGEHTSDPGKPVHEFPPEPGTGEAPEQTSKQHGDQQVTPDFGKDTDQDIDAPNVQPTQGPILTISGPRRRRPAVR